MAVTVFGEWILYNCFYFKFCCKIILSGKNERPLGFFVFLFLTKYSPCATVYFNKYFEKARWSNSLKPGIGCVQI